MLKSKRADSEEVLKLMRPLMPNIKIERETHNMLKFCIPEFYMKRFPEMWDKIWSRKDDLKLKQYDIVSQSFEEIFMLSGKEKIDIENTFRKVPDENIKNVELLTGFKCFKSRMTAVALKKMYNPVAQYLAVLLMLASFVLFTKVSDMAQRTMTSEIWRRVGNGESQMLKYMQMRYFLDLGGGGAFYNQFDDFEKNIEQTLSTYFDGLCFNCIGIERPPDKFFKEMPYNLPAIIPFKYYINRKKYVRRSSMSFTYALDNFQRDQKLAQGVIKNKKKLTVYINMEIAHTSFLSLNFVHSMVLL